jgi:hypothetical protein
LSTVGADVSSVISSGRLLLLLLDDDIVIVVYIISSTSNFVVHWNLVAMYQDLCTKVRRYLFRQKLLAVLQMTCFGEHGLIHPMQKIVMGMGTLQCGVL